MRVKRHKLVPELAQSVPEQISFLVSQGFQPTYTDGSSKRTKSCKLPEIGGVGVYVPPSSPPRILVQKSRSPNL